MSKTMTFGQLMLSKILPEDLYHPGMELNKGKLSEILSEVAKRYPDRYKDISFKLLRLGLKSGESKGGASFGLKDLVASKAIEKRQEKIRMGVKEILDRESDPKKRRREVVDYLRTRAVEMPDAVLEDSKESGNRFALQLEGAGRGNKGSLSSIRAGDVLAEDAQGRGIPVPIHRGYSQGQTLGQYYATAYGGRAGLIDTKLCLLGDTEVRMGDGTVKLIRDIQPGDVVMGSDKWGNLRNTKVTQKFDNGKRRVNTYRFLDLALDDGLAELTATPFHKVLSCLSDDVLDRSFGLHPLSVGQKDKRFRAVMSDLRTARLVEVEPIGFHDTYDIEVEHWSHMFVLANDMVVSNSVGSSGYFSKLLTQAAHRLAVVGDEDPNPVGKDRGLPVEASDPDNVGSLLARDYGPFEANTVITPSMLGRLEELSDSGEILVRSPIASSSLDGGVYAKDVGHREYGRLPRKGEHVGLPASQAIGEKVTQASLSSKHGKAVKGKDATPGLAGFPLIERLVNPPKEGRGLAIHAEVDGKVQDLREAPQGGHYVTVGDQEHYIPAEFSLSAKLGDTVEAGDVITDGIPDPSKVVRLKGIGEGRRYLVNSLRRGLDEAGFSVERRNLELLSRGLLDRVRVSDAFDDFLPGDVTSYSRVEKLYRPRQDAQQRSPSKAVGQYLESPVLHYSIGTRVTPSVRDQLRKSRIDKVSTHPDPAPFEPMVSRGVDVLQTDEDWMTQFLGSNLQKSFLGSVHTGAQSDENSTSFVPVRAKSINLGRTPMTQLDSD